MKNTIILFSKDALSIENLPVYGNTYWKTPNLDELAKKGTVFYNHHTTAASTSMSFSSMLTGKNCFEFENRKTYTKVEPNEKESIFSILQEKGFDCHIIWSPDYMTGAYPYVREFGNEIEQTSEHTYTQIHVIEMQQQAGVHRPKNQYLKRDDSVLRDTISLIKDEINSIEHKDKQFIWLHLPHVIKGRCSYGDDIDVFDEILGFLRERYGDDSIYITADHGHMNLHKNIPAYGFHVYEPTCRVPLITPLINNTHRVDFLTSHIDLIDIILNDKIVKREFVYVDTQYYAQPDRKLAVIGERYKYIYSKSNKKEELYDLLWDKEERFNLLEIERYDKDKMVLRRLTELYFYPYWDEITEPLMFLRSKKDEIWKTASPAFELLAKIKNRVKKIIMYIKAYKHFRK